MRRFSLSVFLAIAIAGGAFAQNVSALVTAAYNGIITANLNLFGFQAQQKIRLGLASPAGNFLYQRMTMLGPISSVTVLNQMPLPNGIAIQARAFHQNGYSDWTLGFSNLSQRIEFGTFNPMPGISSSPTPGPTPGPTPAPTPTTTAAPTTPSIPNTKDDACKMFPTLC